MSKTIIALGIIALLAVAAIAVYYTYDKDNGPLVNPDEEDNQTTNINNLVPVIEDLDNSSRGFDFNLYLSLNEDEKNFMFSPYSISSALAMTYEGARENTADEMANVLDFPEDINQLRNDYKNSYNKINGEHEGYSLSTANAIWAQKDYVFLEDYTSDVEKYYGGKATNLDFKTDKKHSVDIINEWVEDKTNNRIKDLVPDTISEDTKLILTNAVYFKNEWKYKFDGDSTREGYFTTSKGDKVTTDFMHQRNDFKYYEDEYMQMLEMDYEGNELSMLVILPKDNYQEKVEYSLSASNLSVWKSGLEMEDVAVSLPKFKFQNTYFLAEDLKALGMKDAFDEDMANFSGMDGTSSLFIGDVIHKTFIEVNEKGTEAAAATAVIMVGSTGMPSEEEFKYFEADHPFIFIIQHKETGKILFMGKVNNPK